MHDLCIMYFYAEAYNELMTQTEIIQEYNHSKPDFLVSEF